MANGSDLTWEVDIPLATNPLILKAWFMAMGATYLLAMLILGTTFIGSGQGDDLPMLALVFAVGIGLFALLGVLVMVLLFGNRCRARFTITSRGIDHETIDDRARGIARLAVVAGALGGSARTAGAGLVAVSQEQIRLGWSGAFAARYVPRRKAVVLRNQWRDIMHIYCTAENYDDVCGRVALEIQRQGTAARLADTPSPIPGALLHSALVVAACLSLYALGDLADLELIVPLMIMLFSLTMVWLLPLFAWVVLPLVGYVGVYLVIHLTEVRTYALLNTYTYRKYEVLDFGEWALLTAAFCGLAYLGWIALRAVRGRLVPVLFRDMETMS